MKRQRLRYSSSTFLIFRTVLALSSFGMLITAFLWLMGPKSKEPFFKRGNSPQSLSKKSNMDEPFYEQIGASQPKQVRQEPAQTAETAGLKDQFTLEVQSFYNRQQADAYIEQLARQNVGAYFTPLQTADGRVIYRVRLGLFPSFATAQKISDQLKKNQKIQNQIVKLE